MIDLFELYKSFQSYVNTFQGGWFRPQTDFQVACNDISNELWEMWTRMAERSQEITDKLFPFLRSKNIIVKPQNTYYGIFTPPAEYGRYASARIIMQNEKCIECNALNSDCQTQLVETKEQIEQEYYESISEITIEKIDNQRWGSVCEHITKAPTLKNPKLTQIDKGFKVAPRTVTVVVLDYYVRPKHAIFAYTTAPGNVLTGAGDQIIYDPKKSEPLEWGPTVINEFIWRLGERYGFFTRDQFIAQASTQQKMTA